MFEAMLEKMMPDLKKSVEDFIVNLRAMFTKVEDRAIALDAKIDAKFDAQKADMETYLENLYKRIAEESKNGGGNNKG